jgi:hypothetical protein
VERKKFFFCCFFLFSQAREAAKSGLVLFHEAMEEFNGFFDLEPQFQRFERAAAKGHEESIWILGVVKNVEMKRGAWREAFAKTEEPLGWYFAGELSVFMEQFDFYKKSAEGGCSWGQARYGLNFRNGVQFVERDGKVFVEWMEKAANQGNPWAMDKLGYWFRTDGGDKEKAISYYVVAAELGWKNSMRWLAEMFRNGEGCAKDLLQAVIWSAKGGHGVFWELLEDARRELRRGTTEDLDCDFNQLCYSLGWGLYWYKYRSGTWNEQEDLDKAFADRCLDYYCSCVEQQQKSIFTFLLCWNRTTGIKGPGQMIAQMVWEEREDHLVKTFEAAGVEPETKRIKK